MGYGKSPIRVSFGPSGSSMIRPSRVPDDANAAAPCWDVNRYGKATKI